MTMIHKLAISLAGAYGAIALVGGTMGFVKAGSVASLVAGGVSGLVLIGSAVVARRRPKPGLAVACLLSVLLIGRFASGLFAEGGPSPVALVMVIGGLAVLITSLLALLAPASAPSRPLA